MEVRSSALTAIARKAIKRKTGARGLRSIIENVMLDVMFELPSRDDIAKCIITKETLTEKGWMIIHNDTMVSREMFGGEN